MEDCIDYMRLVKTLDQAVAFIFLAVVLATTCLHLGLKKSSVMQTPSQHQIFGDLLCHRYAPQAKASKMIHMGLGQTSNYNKGFCIEY